MKIALVVLLVALFAFSNAQTLDENMPEKCSLCVIIVSIIQKDLIYVPAFKVMEKFNNVCHKLQLGDMCDRIKDKVPEIIQALILKEHPYRVCGSLHFCNNVDLVNSLINEMKELKN